MRIKTFPGGVHLPPYKEATAHKRIEVFPFPEKLVLPLIQHTGAPLKPMVKKGDAVKRGQKIADVDAFVATPLHAPCSGKVSSIEEWPHPVRGKYLSIVLENDGSLEEERRDSLPISEIESQQPQFLREWLREGGIVGLGGAAFPTHVKVSPPAGKTIEFLIVNGAECEPYLTCDQRLMLEEISKIGIGLRVLARASGASKVLVGIEDNKPEVIVQWEEFAPRLPLPVEVIPLKTKYPQGSEKHLIRATLKREVPPGGLPLDVGVVVNNVQTAWAIGRMAEEGLPLVDRVITVSGDAINQPKNLRVPLGSLLQDIIPFCGGVREPLNKVIMGGPMMGVAQVSLSIPVIKGTSGFLFFQNVWQKKEYPCIRCGRCVSSCPMNLVPSQLARLSEFEAFEEAKAERALDCIECGACAYQCPAGIPLVQLIKLAKSEIIRSSRKGGN